MKFSSLTLLLVLTLGVFTWSSCEDDDGDGVGVLSYDGPQFSAPNNGAGFTTFAAFFPGNITQQYEGRSLESVQFYLQEIPLSTSVIVYAAGADNNAPGDVLYERNLTQRINTTGWIEHFLTDPVELTGDGIWIGIETELLNPGQSVGCDQGLDFNPNGDRLQTPSGVWTSFNQITGSERVNWNIRGFVSEQ